MKGDALIARGLEKRRPSVDYGIMFAEFRVRQVSDNEIAEHAELTRGMEHSYHRWVLERRMVKTELMPDGEEQTINSEWGRLGSGDTRVEAIFEAGGTDYKQAISLDSDHAAMVAQIIAERAAFEKADSLRGLLSDSIQAREVFRERAESEFARKTKRVKDDPAKVAALRETITAKYKPEYQALCARVKEVERDYRLSQAEVERLEKLTPAQVVAAARKERVLCHS